MANTLSVSLPFWRRNYSALEFLPSDLITSAFDSILSVTNPLKVNKINEMFSTALQQGGVSYEVFVNSKGQFFNLLRPESNSSKYSNPFNQVGMKLQLAFFTVNVLYSVTDGMRLIDRLTTCVPFLNDGKVEKLPVASIFDQLSVNTLSGHVEKFLTATSLSGQSISSTDLSAVCDSLIDYVVKTSNSASIDDKIKEMEFIEGTPVEIVSYYQLGQIVSMTSSWLKETVSAGDSKCVNCTRVDLPLEINKENAPDLFIKLFRMQLISEEVIKLSGGKKCSFKDFFEYDHANQVVSVKTDFIRIFNDVANSQYLKVIIDVTQDCSSFERRIAKVVPYLKTVMQLCALKNETVPLKVRNLLTCFLAPQQFDESEVIFSGNESIPELENSLIAQERYLSNTIDIINQLLNMFFVEITINDLKGFSLHHYMTNGRDLVYRISKYTKNNKSCVLNIGLTATSKVRLTDRTPAMISFEQHSLVPSEISLDTNFLDNNPFVAMYKEGCENSVSRYGVAIENFKKDEIWSIVSKDGTYLNLYSDSESCSVTCTIERSVLTILPPSAGKDVLSFGATLRRQFNGDKFIAKRLEQKDDIIDVLMGFPARLAANVSPEILESLYLARIASLTGEPIELNGVKPCQYSSKITQMQPLSYLLRKADAFDSSMLSRMLADQGTYFLPSKFNGATDFMDYALPAYSVLNKSYDFTFVVEKRFVASNQILARLAIDHIVVGPVCSDTKPLYTLISSETTQVEAVEQQIDYQMIEKLDNSEVVVKLHLCLRDGVTLARNSIKLRRAGKYLATLDYFDPLLNSAVKKNAVVSVDGQPVSIGGGFFKGYLPIDQAKKPIENALSYATELLKTLYLLTDNSATFVGQVFKEGLNDVNKIVCSELVVLCNYLIQYFSASTPLSALKSDSLGSVGDLVRCMVSNLSVILKGGENLNEVCEKLLSQLTLNVLPQLKALGFLPITLFDSSTSGTMEQILSGVIRFYKKPECVVAVNLAGLNYALNSEFVNFIADVIKQALNQYSSYVSFGGEPTPVESSTDEEPDQPREFSLSETAQTIYDTYYAKVDNGEDEKLKQKAKPKTSAAKDERRDANND